jgi:hypothetical protein
VDVCASAATLRRTILTRPHARVGLFPHAVTSIFIITDPKGMSSAIVT